MKLYVMPRKAARLEQMAKVLLLDEVINFRWVNQTRVRSLFGLCVSLTLALPWARHYIRWLYWDLIRLVRTSKCKLIHQYLRNLGFWKKLSASREMEQGRAVRPMAPEGVTPYRCRRLWLWSNAQYKRSQCGHTRDVVRPKVVYMTATDRSSNSERAESGLVRSEWPFWPTDPAKRNTAAVSAY